MNNKKQAGIFATTAIPKGTLLLELGGLMSADAISASIPYSKNKLKRQRKGEQDPPYNMFSVIWRGPGQCGPGPHADRLLLGPARFVNHSCKPNCKVRTRARQTHPYTFET
jgi:SET domain-containing protein